MIARRTVVLAGAVVAVALAAFAAPFASAQPDGLERVAMDQGIAAAEPVWTAAPAAGYRAPGIAHAGMATGVAGGLGALAVLGLGCGLGGLLARRAAAR